MRPSRSILAVLAFSAASCSHDTPDMGNICCVRVSGPLSAQVEPNPDAPHQPYYYWEDSDAYEVVVTRAEEGLVAWEVRTLNGLNGIDSPLRHGDRPPGLLAQGSEPELDTEVTYRVTIRTEEPTETSWFEFQLTE